VSDDLLYFNGIDAASGDYDLPPLTSAGLSGLIQGQPDPENLDDLKKRKAQKSARHLGVREGVATRGYDIVRIWEASTGREIAHMEHGEWVYSLAFSPNGQWVVSAGCDQVDDANPCISGSARVWEAASGREIAHLTHDAFFISIAFSPDGKLVASGSADGLIIVWEAATGQEIARMRHDSSIRSVIFSPDGQWVASASDDCTVSVWEAVTGKEYARVVHDKAVYSVSFSPDGKWIASGSLDGTARVLWWRPEDLARLACQRLPRNLTRQEWEQFLPGEPYQPTCPNLPTPPEE
jgi:WD40 repeat protein